MKPLETSSLRGPFGLGEKFLKVARAASLNSKDVHPAGVYFFGRPPTTGNRRMIGLRALVRSDEQELYVTRLDVWQEILVPDKVVKGLQLMRLQNVRHPVMCQTMEFSELREFLRGNIFYVGPAGWEARVVSKKSRASAVEIVGEYGPPYQI